MIVNIVQYESGSTHLCFWRYFFVKKRIYRQKLKPGGLLGLGMGNSIQKHFYLPEPQTDFIFAIICEELGFVGAGVVIFLFGFIIYRGFSIAIGITFMFAFQAILNLSVVVGLIPVTGVTLPFLSYGGSSLLITMISMGILLNISKK